MEQHEFVVEADCLGSGKYRAYGANDSLCQVSQPLRAGLTFGAPTALKAGGKSEERPASEGEPDKEFETD